MSSKERKTLSILQQQIGGLLTVGEASAELGITERHFYRIKARFLVEGDQGLLHQGRGRPSNNAYYLAVRAEVLDIYRRKYPDYGPTFFAERLEVNEGYVIDHETLRRWLLKAGLMPAVRKGKKHRKKRDRQPHIGSMIQLDGSDHPWFEDRGPRCTLLVYIDDASNRVYMRFAVSENSRDVLMATMEYILRFGIPAVIYTDRGSAFYHMSKTTDFVRALNVLGTKVIYAGSPQAKGRVERANRTQQDRLVKVLRERDISTIEEANAFLENEYLAAHNERFAQLDGLEDIHRPVGQYDLKNIFCFEHHRCVRSDMTIQFRSQELQILPSAQHCPLPKQYVTLRQWLDGSIHLFWREQELPWKLATDQQPKRKAHPFGQAETRDHPWQHKPVGKLKRVPKRCR